MRRGILHARYTGHSSNGASRPERGSRMGTRRLPIGVLVAALCLAGFVLGTPGVSHASSSQFCKDNLALAKTNGSLAKLNAGLDPPSIADFKKAASAIKRLIGEAPSAIKSDMQTVATALNKAAQQGTAPWTARKTQAAATRAGRWVDKNC